MQKLFYLYFLHYFCNTKNDHISLATNIPALLRSGATKDIFLFHMMMTSSMISSIVGIDFIAYTINFSLMSSKYDGEKWIQH